MSRENKAAGREYSRPTGFAMLVRMKGNIRLPFTLPPSRDTATKLAR
jgi:hypothetical protein